MIPDIFADYNRIYLEASSHVEGMKSVISEIEKDYPEADKRRAFIKNLGYFHPDFGVSDIIGLVRVGVAEDIRDADYERLWKEAGGRGLTDLILVHSKKDPKAYEDEIHRLATKPQWSLFSLPDCSLTVVRSAGYQDTAVA